MELLKIRGDCLLMEKNGNTIQCSDSSISVKNILNKLAALLLLIFMTGENSGLTAQRIAKSEEKTYKNPLPVSLADPYVLYVKGDKYYLYGTGGVRNGFI